MIKIKDGFLTLPLTSGKSAFVKGSAISCVMFSGTIHDGKNCSQVTIGSDSWAIEVTEEPEQVLVAIGESYKQARSR